MESFGHGDKTALLRSEGRNGGISTPSQKSYLKRYPRSVAHNRDLFINQENQKETLNMLIAGVAESVKIIMDNNSEDGKYPKATFGFDHALAGIKNTYARWRFPETGRSVDDVMKLFFDAYTMGINPGSPSYMGHMLPALNRIALAAWVIANVLNQNMIAHEVAPVFTQMENQVISFLSDLIGYDIMKSGWAIVSGGTNANHTAMLVARNKLLPWVEKHGVHKALRTYNKDNNTHYEDFVIFVWEDAHYSIEKLAGYIGIGSDQVKIIPFIKWSHSILDANRLEEMIREAEENKELIIGISVTAGTTEKGNVHNIDDIMWVAKNRSDGRDFYVHVDAAHGGGFLTNDNIKRNLFQWIDQADSVTVDGHKMFYTNYGCGGIIFKDQASLWYIKQSAPYVLPEDTENENHGSYTIEWSRGVAGLLQLWMSIMHFGKEEYGNIMEELINKTKSLEEKLSANHHFELLWKSELNLLCFRYDPRSPLVRGEKSMNDFNKLLKQTLLKDGNFYLSDTEIDGKTCFRAVIMNLWTDDTYFDGLIAKMTSLGDEIIAKMLKLEKRIEHSLI